MGGGVPCTYRAKGRKKWLPGEVGTSGARLVLKDEEAQILDYCSGKIKAEEGEFETTYYEVVCDDAEALHEMTKESRKCNARERDAVVEEKRGAGEGVAGVRRNEINDGVEGLEGAKKGAENGNRQKEPPKNGSPPDEKRLKTRNELLHLF